MSESRSLGVRASWNGTSDEQEPALRASRGDAAVSLPFHPGCLRWPTHGLLFPPASRCVFIRAVMAYDSGREAVKENLSPLHCLCESLKQMFKIQVYD